jgi:hypothetical protein
VAVVQAGLPADYTIPVGSRAHLARLFSDSSQLISPLQKIFNYNQS